MTGFLIALGAALLLIVCAACRRRNPDGDGPDYPTTPEEGDNR